MDTLSKKTIQTKRGFTYTYYTTPAAEGKPTLLLQHGFPDEAFEWEDLIIRHLRPAGYGAIAPDMLGYAGTSKPLDPAAYKFTLMTNDLEEIVDAEGIDKVISLGHDWGSRAAQMFYNLKPDRCLGLCAVNVPYSPPSTQPFDLDALLATIQKAYGHGGVWYWKLFTADDGAALLNSDPGLVFDLGASPSTWLETLCTKDGVRNAIEKRNVQFKVLPYANKEVKDRFVERMSRDKFDAPVCWYKATVFGHQDGEGDPQNAVVNVPTLYICYKGDVLAPVGAIQPAVAAGLLPHLTNVNLEGHHWGLHEDPETFGKTITSWLQKEFGS